MGMKFKDAEPILEKKKKKKTKLPAKIKPPKTYRETARKILGLKTGLFVRLHDR